MCEIPQGIFVDKHMKKSCRASLILKVDGTPWKHRGKLSQVDNDNAHYSYQFSVLGEITVDGVLCKPRATWNVIDDTTTKTVDDSRHAFRRRQVRDCWITTWMATKPGKHTVVYNHGTPL